MIQERLNNFNLDFIVSSLASQIDALQKLQKDIEQRHVIDEYSSELIKDVEKRLYWLRRFIVKT